MSILTKGYMLSHIHVFKLGGMQKKKKRSEVVFISIRHNKCNITHNAICWVNCVHLDLKLLGEIRETVRCIGGWGVAVCSDGTTCMTLLPLLIEGDLRRNPNAVLWPSSTPVSRDCICVSNPMSCSSKSAPSSSSSSDIRRPIVLWIVWKVNEKEWWLLWQ